MRVLLDEMMSRKLVRELAGHDVSTVQREGWAGLTNGALLDAIASRFDIFVTMDKGMYYQQQFTRRPFGIVQVRARSTAIRDLLSALRRIDAAIQTVQPGEIVTVSVLEEDSGL